MREAACDCLLRGRGVAARGRQPPPSRRPPPGAQGRAAAQASIFLGDAANGQRLCSCGGVEAAFCSHARTSCAGRVGGKGRCTEEAGVGSIGAEASTAQQQHKDRQHFRLLLQRRALGRRQRRGRRRGRRPAGGHCPVPWRLLSGPRARGAPCSVRLACLTGRSRGTRVLRLVRPEVCCLD